MRFSVDVGNGAKQQLFVGCQNQLSFCSCECKRLLLTSSVGLELMAIVSCPVRQFCFFKLLARREELCGGYFLFADWRNKDQIQPANVVNGNSGIRVSGATDGRGVERKTKRVVELFPSL